MGKYIGKLKLLILSLLVLGSFIPSIGHFGGNRLNYATAISGAEYAHAAVHVKGYYKKNGTYVAPHYRSNPDGNPYNNWSYPGNTNPYTGKTASGNGSTYLKNYNSKTGSYSSAPVKPKVSSVPKIIAPANAYVLGANWYCLTGYKQIGNSCEKVIAPANAYVLGANWYCLPGYTQIGSGCVDNTH